MRTTAFFAVLAATCSFAVALVVTMRAPRWSCRPDAAPATPPLRVGQYYDIRTTDPKQFQASFRVLSVGPGSWIEVETFDRTEENDKLLWAAMVEAGKVPADVTAADREASATRITTHPAWINLAQVVSITVTDEEAVKNITKLTGP